MTVTRKPGPRRRVRRSTAIAATLALAATLISACTPESTGDSTSSTSLTIAVESEFTFSPVTNTAPNAIFPVYDSLIYLAADGSYEPDLATSWGFVGDDNRTFKLTLTEGATFADGAPLNGENAAASMNAFINGDGHAVGKAGPVESVTGSGNEVVITYTRPIPESTVLYSLTQTQSFGLLVGPEAVADPTTLEAAPNGVGQYTLDESGTTPGVTYTYTQNRENYFNPSAIKYDKVIVKVITDPTTRYNALRSGQVDVASGMPATMVSSAEPAGFQVIAANGGTQQLILLNRENGPLADPTVRQALAYALDRSAINEATQAGLAEPTSTLGTEGLGGYNASDPQPYTYNLEKAKELLAQTPYASGFTLEVLDAEVLDPNGALGQALASQLEEIGVKVNLTMSNTTLAQLIGDIESKKFHALVFPFSIGDIYTQYYSNLAPGEIANPFEIADADLESLLVSAAGASGREAQDAGLAEVTAHLDATLPTIPVLSVKSFNFVAASVKNVASTVATSNQADPFSPLADQAWHD